MRTIVVAGLLLALIYAMLGSVSVNEQAWTWPGSTETPEAPQPPSG